MITNVDSGYWQAMVVSQFFVVSWGIGNEDEVFELGMYLF